MTPQAARKWIRRGLAIVHKPTGNPYRDGDKKTYWVCECEFLASGCQGLRALLEKAGIDITKPYYGTYNCTQRGYLVWQFVEDTEAAGAIGG
jgi:hypothetical protein